ncbi:MarR family transcriptional regulator [Leptospira perolatii]|uniref:MarR family transcriptional regulator n=1 Tax=Leptospira perolatii TaxID=2023191 RepID=A0A2M9ZJI9_9LEPT|nr:MarR family winged helix-turn-helix transcriptional regulator [Leptospira perolatii]PJZ68860.1 MarR family transcriptional regulator [Leptospira perolatii]PJZ72191.1 MarR family transcriptional regulator [Leptospira perolatii]
MVESADGKFDVKNQLGFNIHRTAILFRRELLRALQEYDMTPEQWQALATLWKMGGVTQQEIISVTLQDAPTASRMIQRMEKNGLVKKTRSHEDNRATIILLTSKGKKLESILPRLLREHFAPILGKLGKEKTDQLLKLLAELRDAFGDPV